MQASALPPPSLDARLFVVRMLLDVTKQPALLQLHVEALQSLVNGFVLANCDLNQTASPPEGNDTKFSPDLEVSWPLVGRELGLQA